MFTGGVHNTVGRWGLFMESAVLTVGIPSASSKYFSVAGYLQDSSFAQYITVEGSTGYVGIGTNAAAGKLCVNGGVHIGGDSDAGDNNLLVDGDVFVSDGLHVGGNSAQSWGIIKAEADIRAAGDVIAYYSDERLKTNIIPISNALDKLNLIRGVYFDWNEKANKIHIGKHDIGVIAQEVQKVIPEAVTDVWGEGEEKYHSVLYDKLVPSKLPIEPVFVVISPKLRLEPIQFV